MYLYFMIMRTALRDPKKSLQNLHFAFLERFFILRITLSCHTMLEINHIPWCTRSVWAFPLVDSDRSRCRGRERGTWFLLTFLYTTSHVNKSNCSLPPYRWCIQAKSVNLEYIWVILSTMPPMRRISPHSHQRVYCHECPSPPLLPREKWSHSEHLVLVGLFPPLVVHGCIAKNLAIRDDLVCPPSLARMRDNRCRHRLSSKSGLSAVRPMTNGVCCFCTPRMSVVGTSRYGIRSTQRTRSHCPLSLVPLRHFGTTSGTPLDPLTHRCDLDERCKGVPNRSSVRLRIFGISVMCQHEVVPHDGEWNTDCNSRIPLRMNFFKISLNSFVSSNMRLIGSTSSSSLFSHPVVEPTTCCQKSLLRRKSFLVRFSFHPFLVHISLHGVDSTWVHTRELNRSHHSIVPVRPCDRIVPYALLRLISRLFSTVFR